MIADESRKFQDIVRAIKRDIVVGKVKSNEKIPSERELSEEFGVGRGTIREALKTLEAIGLLTTVRGRAGGYFVNEGALEISQDALASTIKLEESIIIDSLIFRKMFEPKICLHAALNRSVRNLHEMRRAISDMEKGSEDPEACARANLKFHLEIGKSSKNPFVVEFYPHLFNMLMETSKMVHHLPTQIEVTIFFHKEIFETIKKKQPEKAEILMDGHLSYIINDMQQAKELRMKSNKSSGKGS